MDLIYRSTFRPGPKANAIGVEAIVDMQSNLWKHYFCNFFQNLVMQKYLLLCYIYKT